MGYIGAQYKAAQNAQNQRFSDRVIGWMKCAGILWGCVERVKMSLVLYRMENGRVEPEIQKWWKIHSMMENPFCAELAIWRNLACSNSAEVWGMDGWTYRVSGLP